MCGYERGKVPFWRHGRKEEKKVFFYGVEKGRKKEEFLLESRILKKRERFSLTHGRKEKKEFSRSLV